jgi:UDP-N-acetyl-2-amino-2-deoxyglucuronate dehydrogenase
MGEVIGIGVVGCGMMAQLHTSSLAMLQASGMPIRAVAAADPDPAAREATQHNWQFERLHSDAAAVLADPEVDAVYVCTPTSLHHELYVGAFEAGKHLYAEKPLAPTLELARSIARACPPSTICQVGFQLRRHALISEVRRLVRSGELGPVMAYLFRDDESFPTTSITPHSSEWRSRRELAGGGTLLEHSIHGIDLLHWIFGRPLSVTARTRHTLGLDVEDTATLLIEHDSGVAGTLVSVYGCVRGREESRLEVFCRDGVVEVTWGVLVESGENRLRVQRSGEPPVDHDPLITLDDHLTRIGLSERPFLWNELASRAFIESLLAGRPASPGLDDALTAHATVDAAYRSAATGLPERVDER